MCVSGVCLFQALSFYTFEYSTVEWWRLVVEQAHTNFVLSFVSRFYCLSKWEEGRGKSVGFVCVCVCVCVEKFLTHTYIGM
jgi:hypothetical protein